MISRRHVAGFVAASVFSTRSDSAFAQPINLDAVARPDSSRFQNGDLLWPKKPGTYVPYHAPVTAPTSAPDSDADASQWGREKVVFLANVEQQAPHFTAQATADTQKLSFLEFHARYAGYQVPNAPGVYSAAAGLYVGHVGIVEIDPAGTPWVIEALLDRGVVRRRYEEWLAQRTGEAIWQGRLRNLSASKRNGMVDRAKQQIGKPYNFWNFDLSDASSFYCSKLVWFCAFQSTGVALDGNSNPKRFFWFSPKQLLYSATVERVFDPGPYASQ